MSGKDQIKTVKVDALWRRLLLLVPAALALYGASAVARWCLGNTLAANPPEVEAVLAAARTRPNDPAVRQAVDEIGRVLHTAERLAPDDPQVHFSLGVFARRSFSPEELEDALRRYERATALSPNDYRLWMELGRARGQAGDYEGGEQALMHAVKLAPHYSLPHWYLGNLRLRSGREREGFDELRRAAEIDSKLHTQIFTMAWSYFGGNLNAVAAAVGDSAAARARLVEYLISQKRIEEALALWSLLKAEEKKEQAAAGRVLAGALLSGGRFRKVLEIYGEFQPDSVRGVTVGQIINGGFEDEIGPGPFDWVIRSVPQAQMALGTRAPHGGARSLRIDFNAPNNFNFGQIQQLVLVEPQARYRLEYFVRTEDLKTAATLIVAILNPAGQGIATSPPAPTGTNDWQQMALEFATPAGAEAVTIMILRAPCADESCPVYGKAWYDDFNLQPLGGIGAGARATKGK